MKKPKLLVLATVVGLFASAVSSQATLSLNFSNEGLNTGIQFNGASSSFQLNPAPGSLGSPQFRVNSETGGSAALGLFGWINGSPWTIGPVTTTGQVQSAAVTGTGSLFLNDGAGNNLTGTLNWISIETFQFAGGINSDLVLNISGLSYGGVNADLLSLASHGNGSLNMTFQFDPGQTLSQLVQGSAQMGAYSGALSAPTVVPEPSTVIAGALLLLPFGASTMRFMRKRRTA